MVNLVCFACTIQLIAWKNSLFLNLVYILAKIREKK